MLPKEHKKAMKNQMEGVVMDHRTVQRSMKTYLIMSRSVVLFNVSYASMYPFIPKNALSAAK